MISEIDEDLHIDDLLNFVDLDQDERFTTISNTEKELLLESAIPANTRKRNQWAFKILKTWNEWRKKYWAENGGPSIVLKDFDEMFACDLDYLLQDFIISARKENKEPYPPASLRSIISGIMAYFRHQFSRTWDFFKDKEFSESRKVLDAKMRELTRHGVGINKRKAAPISMNTENEMWDQGILGDDDPKKLMNTILYLLGVHFALRSREEHRSLRFGDDSQLKLGSEDGVEFLKYREDCSKTRHGGIRDRFREPKEVIVYGGMTGSHKDLILLYKKYISHRPPEAKTNAFYLKPLKNPKGNIWYAEQPVGVNTISMVVKNLMKFKEDSNFYTNHSLRRTAVCRLNQAGFDIESIKKRTGHNTNEGLMAYDVVDKTKIVAQCNALYGDSEKKDTEIMKERAGSLFCGATINNCVKPKTNDETIENVMKQKTDSLFCGANISNCTFKFYLNSSNP